MDLRTRLTNVPGSRRVRAMVEDLLCRRAARHHQGARRLMELRQEDAAFAKFEQAVSLCPSRLDWLVEYGRLAIRHRRWGVAKRAFDRAIAQRSGVATWYAARAHTLVALDQLDDAIADYRTALALESGRGSWSVALGRALASSGALAEAIEACGRAVELEPDNAEWWAALATLQRRAGAIEDAVEALGRALAIRGKPKWHALRGRALEELGRAEPAITDFRRAVDLDPTQVGWWSRLGHLLGSDGRTEEAVDAWRAALALDGSQARIHASLGRLLAQRGERESAIEHLARAIELDGHHPDWRADLSELEELASNQVAGAPSAEKDARWYDTVYQHSEKYQLSYEASPYWPVWQRILDRLAAATPSAIIEIGCGPGQLAAAFRDRATATSYLGIDFSAEAIEMARASIPEFTFVVGDALDAPEVDQFPYDVVVCTEVLEHIERDRDVIRRWRAGAEVVATVPSYDSAAHVRFFRDVDEVRSRYEDLIDDLTVERIAIGRSTHLFLMCGRMPHPTQPV